MQYAQHNSIVSFIWNIADDVLRDVYVRGKYRDVILPMTVIRRLDVLLEPTKEAVLAMKQRLDQAGVQNQDGALKSASRNAFYNTSKFTLKSLRSAPSQLRANFTDYLDGFSDNVQEIIEKFRFRDQLLVLEQADRLYHLVEKFVDPAINLSPNPVLDGQGQVRLPGLDNHAMGTIFEELIRRFNEENNEEAGEHWTPRDVVTLMANLIFQPIADRIESGTYLVYDGACGSGGMLTISDDVLSNLARSHGKDVAIHLHGQESQPETYAICKADLLLKGEGAEAESIKFGSTLSSDYFPSLEFDFMLSNPPYGKSWKVDLDRLCGGNRKDITDPRFVVVHESDPEFNLVTRSSDGQLMFLVNMLSKMKQNTALGSRIAEVHNGSSLFTGDAGQGESNIRRWIIENDWLEAIIALPLNMFYNTGIATYIWVLSNRKPQHRQGRVQLIDATKWFTKLRRNLGQKNCELGPEHRTLICDIFLNFQESEQSKIFPNQAFGYWKITVERPLRLKVDLSPEHREEFRRSCHQAKEQQLAQVVDRVAEQRGPGPHLNYNDFASWVEEAARQQKTKLPGKSKRLLATMLAQRDESAARVIKKRNRGGSVEYEPDAELRDTEQVPLLEEGGIPAFFQREVLPYVPDAWIDESKTNIGYEISFTRYFYQPQPLRTLAEIRADIDALEQETEGLIGEILVEVAAGA